MGNKNKISVEGHSSSHGPSYTKVKYGNSTKNLIFDNYNWVGSEFNKNNFSANIGYNTESKNKGIKIKWEF